MRISFFATRSDLELLATTVEGEYELKYVIAGLRATSSPEVFFSLTDVPDFARSTSGDTVHQNRYLVFARTDEVVVEPVPQRRGGLMYQIDQSLNDRTISLRTGGEYDDRHVISGEIINGSRTAESLRYFRAFERVIKRSFQCIRTYYVGSDAARKLDDGARLTARIKAPTIYDLKR